MVNKSRVDKTTPRSEREFARISNVNINKITKDRTTGTSIATENHRDHHNHIISKAIDWKNLMLSVRFYLPNIINQIIQVRVCE